MAKPCCVKETKQNKTKKNVRLNFSTAPKGQRLASWSLHLCLARRTGAEKEACWLLKADPPSCASANTPLQGTLHLFRKVSIDPTHREMTPLYSRRACQSARHLFSYNMFHIFIANTTSGVLVSPCIKLMLHFHERLNTKRRKELEFITRPPVHGWWGVSRRDKHGTAGT